jgi:hypothetical protein
MLQMYNKWFLELQSEYMHAVINNSLNKFSLFVRNAKHNILNFGMFKPKEES